MPFDGTDIVTDTDHADNLIHFGTAADRLDMIGASEAIVSPAIAFPGGLVCSGHTYAACESAAVLAGFRGIVWPDMRGFFTSAHRFASPRRALRIALAAGQIKGKPPTPKAGLTIADIWPTPIHVAPKPSTDGPRYA